MRLQKETLKNGDFILHGIPYSKTLHISAKFDGKGKSLAAEITPSHHCPMGRKIEMDSKWADLLNWWGEREVKRTAEQAKIPGVYD